MTEQQIIAKIKERRETIGMSIRQAAINSGVRWHTYRDIEAGTHSPSLRTLTVISQTLSMVVSVNSTAIS